mmetsp:Transcript_55343/g.139921  ORF Transcript_55343/g.139921 Transcript_55343/m.139921 type:complete len:82 (+) Transcript_55343:856-1101(+)
MDSCTEPCDTVSQLASKLATCGERAFHECICIFFVFSAETMPAVSQRWPCCDGCIPLLLTSRPSTCQCAPVDLLIQQCTCA